MIFATPTLDHRVTLDFFRSSLETDWLLATHGVPHGYKQVGGDQFIAKARNRLVAEFLIEFPMATDLFFLDDDISWPAAKVLEFLNRPEDVVCGVYPKKTETLEFPVELESQDGALIEHDGLYRAVGAPTGFMRIKRHVLESLASYARMYEEENKDGTKGKRWAIFEAGVNYDAGAFWGEDYVFCQKARARGFGIWVDPNIAFTHRGQRNWSGTLAPTIQSWIDAHPPAAGR